MCVLPPPPVQAPPPAAQPPPAAEPTAAGAPTKASGSSKPDFALGASVTAVLATTSLLFVAVL